MSLRVSCPAQRPPWGTESPTALLKSCLSVGVWRRRGKPCPGQTQPFMPAAPSLHRSTYPHPCLSLCTCRNNCRDCLLLCKPQLHRSLCSFSLCAAAGCLGRVSINILYSILAFPCLGLFCSGNGAFSSASIVQTKCLQALSYVRHHIHWEGCYEEERVPARLGLGALHHSEKQLIPCGLGW